jgi:hypothetical protein
MRRPFVLLVEVLLTQDKMLESEEDKKRAEIVVSREIKLRGGVYRL